MNKTAREIDLLAKIKTLEQEGTESQEQSESSGLRREQEVREG